MSLPFVEISWWRGIWFACFLCMEWGAFVQVTGASVALSEMPKHSMAALPARPDTPTEVQVSINYTVQ